VTIKMSHRKKRPEWRSGVKLRSSFTKLWITVICFRQIWR